MKQKEQLNETVCMAVTTLEKRVIEKLAFNEQRTISQFLRLKIQTILHIKKSK